jgi:hypothetical protein
MSALSPTGRLSPILSPQAALRARIGWLCHLIRIAAVVWALWILATIAWYWSDSAAIVKGFGGFLKVDLSGVSNVQYALAVAGKLGSWALQAAVSYCIWRQFGTYLQGRIFTIDAAMWMRRVGIAGLAALLFSLVWRHLIIVILAFHVHLPARTFLSGPWAGPFDLLQALFCLAVIGFAQIYNAAADMVDDHARIV